MSNKAATDDSRVPSAPSPVGVCRVDRALFDDGGHSPMPVASDTEQRGSAVAFDPVHPVIPLMGLTPGSEAERFRNFIDTLGNWAVF